MTPSAEVGQKGEEIARKFFEQKGYQILEQNYRYKRGEIDLIAKHKEWLVFVEVKTRTALHFGEFPEAGLSDAQVDRILKVAAFYRRENPSKYTRFDVVSIIITANGYRLKHFEDAFWP